MRVPITVGHHRAHYPMIGCVSQTPNEWVRQHEVGHGMHVGVSSDETVRMEILSKKLRNCEKPMFG